MKRQDLELMTQIIFAAQQQGDKDFEIENELLDALPIAQILKRKIEVFNLPVKVTKFAYVLLTLYSEGHPAFAQYLLVKLLEELKGKKEKVIDVNLIVNTWPMEVPTIDDNFSQWWNGQKGSAGFTGNQVDTPEFWEKLIA